MSGQEGPECVFAALRISEQPADGRPVEQQQATVTASNSHGAPELAPADAVEPDDCYAEQRGIPKACLFVASLNIQQNEEEMRASVTSYFKQWGHLLNVKVFRDKENRPYAFVQYERVGDAEQALKEAHNTTLDGRSIRVEHAKVNRTLVVSKIDRKLTEPELHDIFSQYGQVEDVLLIVNKRTHESRARVFVKYCHRDDALNAYSSIKSDYKWAVEWAASLKPKEFYRDGHPIENDNTTAFVGRLNPDLVTPELLRDRFSTYGEVENVDLVITTHNPLRGPHNQQHPRRTYYAFVKFRDELATAKAVQQADGEEWLGNRITVNYRELPESHQHGRRLRSGPRSTRRYGGGSEHAGSAYLPAMGMAMASGPQHVPYGPNTASQTLT